MFTTKSLFTKSNYDINQSIQWKILSDDQCEEIVMAAFELLERTGFEVANAAAAAVYEKGGCWVQNTRVRIPSPKLEWALRAAPSRVTLCDRSGKRAILMETENVYYGPGFGNKKTVDLQTGDIRNVVKQDIADLAKVGQGLSQIDFLANGGLPSDVNAATAELHSFEALVSNAEKPIVQEVKNGRQAKAIWEMAVAVAGGEIELRMNPFFALYTENTEALVQQEDASDIIVTGAEKGIPVIFNQNLVSGATAPATSTGTLIVALANALAGLVLSQLVREGSPIVLGGSFTIFDTVNDLAPLGAPEVSLLGTGFSNLLRFLHLPSFGSGGGTDSKCSDAQMGLEAAFSILHLGLSGTNLISGAGQMETGEYASPYLLVIGDELMGMTRRIMRGVEVTEDKLARGVIDDVQPGGHYLGSPHTMRYFREEQFWPKLMNRKRIDDWTAAGGKTLGERAEDKTKELLQYNQANPLASEVAKKLHDIIAKTEQNL